MIDIHDRYLRFTFDPDNAILLVKEQILKQLPYLFPRKFFNKQHHQTINKRPMKNISRRNSLTRSWAMSGKAVYTWLSIWNRFIHSINKNKVKL